MPVVLLPYITWQMREPGNGRNEALVWLPEQINHSEKAMGLAAGCTCEARPDLGDLDENSLHDVQTANCPIVDGADRSLRTQIKTHEFRVDNLCKEPEPDCLEIHHSITNLTGRTWHNVVSVVCIQLVKAPDFRYGSAEQLFCCSTEGIQSFRAMETAASDHVDRRFAPPDVTLAHPLVMVRSLCGEFTLGHAFLNGTGSLFANRLPRVQCIHSQRPVFDSLRPNETKTRVGVLFTVRGGPEDALSYYLSWRDGAAGSR